MLSHYFTGKKKKYSIFSFSSRTQSLGAGTFERNVHFLPVTSINVYHPPPVFSLLALPLVRVPGRRLS